MGRLGKEYKTGEKYIMTGGKHFYVPLGDVKDVCGMFQDLRVDIKIQLDKTPKPPPAKEVLT